jgi:hypothetical protein
MEVLKENEDLRELFMMQVVTEKTLTEEEFWNINQMSLQKATGKSQFKNWFDQDFLKN